MTKKHSNLKVSEKGVQRCTSVKVEIGKLVTERMEPVESRYLFKEMVGKGGFGKVRKVQDRVTGQELAMKVIPKKSVHSLSVELIENEIEVLKRLDHPNIIKLYEFAQDTESYYLITELCKGGELFDRISKMKNFSEMDAARIMRSVISAVSYCHNINVVHRDLKPENILFDSKGEDAIIKVIDFGTSMIFERNSKMNQRFGTVNLPIIIALLHRTRSSKWRMLQCEVRCVELWCDSLHPALRLPALQRQQLEPDPQQRKEGKVLLRRYSGRNLIGRAWRHISPEAKSFIARLLEYSPAKRISAREALGKRWIQGGRKSMTSAPPIKSSLRNLQSFKVQCSLQQLVMIFIANRLQSKDEQKRLQSEFAGLDTNGDGSLQREELVSGYIRLGKKPAEAGAIVDRIMAEIDTNNNGTIDFSEFLMANLKMQEAVEDKQLMEAFKLFDKVLSTLTVGWEWTDNGRRIEGSVGSGEGCCGRDI
eukprot:TRINITY_DN12828_c0_g2_i4.p1 TRINITY_DN12828_c0_g2~~TRINITY_DN12828_c0_g2_i4.p1  ORF type:complete len:479 (-),score=99.03 TRINITY_DN12828_c0_g2_i4:215-1651(-)